MSKKLFGRTERKRNWGPSPILAPVYQRKTFTLSCDAVCFPGLSRVVTSIAGGKCSRLLTYSRGLGGAP